MAVEKNHSKKTGGESGAAASFLLSKYLGKQKTVNQTVQQHHKTVAYFRRSVV
jgi:hypothetical protein